MPKLCNPSNLKVFELKYNEPAGATFDNGRVDSGPVGILNIGPKNSAFAATDRLADKKTLSCTDKVPAI